MGCEHAMAVMSEYLDGVLDDAQKEQLENHIMGCERCRMYLAELRATLELAGELKPEAPDVLPEVTSGLHAEDKPDLKKRRSRRLKYAATLAAVLVFGVLVILNPFGANKADEGMSESSANAPQEHEEYSGDAESIEDAREKSAADAVQRFTLSAEKAQELLGKLSDDVIIERGDDYAVIDSKKAGDILEQYDIIADSVEIMLAW